MAESTKDIESILKQARQWEEQQEYERAVDCYLKVNSKVTRYMK